MVGQVRYLMSSCFDCLQVCSSNSCLTLPVSGHPGFNDPGSDTSKMSLGVATPRDGTMSNMFPEMFLGS